MSYYSRKSPRIPDYDYSRENYYFITICSYHKNCIFGSIDQKSKLGIVAEEHLKKLSSHYNFVYVDKYVVMPNHIHLILILDTGNNVDAKQIVAQYKAGVSREIRKIEPNIKVWQRSFHDHVIRSQADYERIWCYIENNPQNWNKDCFYVDQSIVPGW